MRACQLLETFLRLTSAHLTHASLQGSVSQKISLHHIVFSYLLKRYGPDLQNDTKLDITSCSLAEKMAKDQRSFCTQSLWEANWWSGSFVIFTKMCNMNKAVNILVLLRGRCRVCKKKKRKKKRGLSGRYSPKKG